VLLVGFAARGFQSACARRGAKWKDRFSSGCIHIAGVETGREAPSVWSGQTADLFRTMTMVLSIASKSAG